MGRNAQIRSSRHAATPDIPPHMKSCKTPYSSTPHPPIIHFPSRAGPGDNLGPPHQIPGSVGGAMLFIGLGADCQSSWVGKELRAWRVASHAQSDAALLCTQRLQLQRTAIRKKHRTTPPHQAIFHTTLHSFFSLFWAFHCSSSGIAG